MAKRQREWARRARVALLIRLGGRCRNCGERDLALLVPNHIDPNTRTWDTHKLKSITERIPKYHADEKAGLLECLCVDCNNQVGNRYVFNARQKAELLAEINAVDEVPF
jgi:hypothetical protein